MSFLLAKSFFIILIGFLFLFMILGFIVSNPFTSKLVKAYFGVK